jgi:hypothetical protein
LFLASDTYLRVSLKDEYKINPHVKEVEHPEKASEIYAKECVLISNIECMYIERTLFLDHII